jgi:hypothetical protein
MQHKNAAPTGVFQQTNKADFSAENKEDKAAPFGIGSLLSSPAEPQAKAKKAKNAEAAAPVVEEAAVSQDEPASEEPAVSSDAETA